MYYSQGWKIQVYFYLVYLLDERMEINVIVIKNKYLFSEIPSRQSSMLVVK